MARDGGACQQCGAVARLLVVAPCAHLFCLDCVSMDRQACPSCRKPYQMQSVADPTRLENNPNPKWDVPMDVIEWQCSYTQKVSHEQVKTQEAGWNVLSFGVWHGLSEGSGGRGEGGFYACGKRHLSCAPVQGEAWVRALSDTTSGPYNMHWITRTWCGHEMACKESCSCMWAPLTQPLVHHD